LGRSREGMLRYRLLPPSSVQPVAVCVLPSTPTGGLLRRRSAGRPSRLHCRVPLRALTTYFRSDREFNRGASRANQGMGGLLLRHFTEEVTQRGCTRVTIEVAAANRSARRFLSSRLQRSRPSCHVLWQPVRRHSPAT
jgi:hypothetical protein